MNNNEELTEYWKNLVAAIWSSMKNNYCELFYCCAICFIILKHLIVPEAFHYLPFIVRLHSSISRYSSLFIYSFTLGRRRVKVIYVIRVIVTLLSAECFIVCCSIFVVFALWTILSLRCLVKRQKDWLKDGWLLDEPHNNEQSFDQSHSPLNTIRSYRSLEISDLPLKHEKILNFIISSFNFATRFKRLRRIFHIPT